MAEDKEKAEQEAKKMAEIETIMKRRTLILDSLNLIPIYTGQDLTWSLQQFKSKFTALAEFLHWPAEDQLFAIQQRLAGLALQTYLNFKHNIKSVKDLFEIFKEKFESKRDQGDLLNEFWLFKQQPDISVAEFIAKSKLKANAAIAAHNLPKDCEEKTKDQWLISMLLKNLIPQVRKGVIARNPATLKELEDIALLEERAYKAVPFETHMQTDNINLVCAINSDRKEGPSQNSETDSFHSFASEMKEQLAKLSEKISKIEKTSAQSNRDIIICHKCKQAGHIQRFCPESQRECRYNSRRNEGSNFRSRDADRREVRFARDNAQTVTNRERNYYRNSRGGGGTFTRNSNERFSADSLNR